MNAENTDAPRYYGQSPYSQQPPPPPLPGSSSRWGPTTMGIDPAIAAGLGYLFGVHFPGILPIIWLIAEKRNRFIRFHAAQALLLVASYIVGMLFAGVVFVGGLLIGLASGLDAQTAGGIAAAVAIALVVVLSVAVLVFEIWGIIAGFSGKIVKFPLIGNLAERMVGGPPIPLF
jgi:uncharacterized membrane protein